MKRIQGVALVSFALVGLMLVVARCGGGPSAAATDAGRALSAMSSATQAGDTKVTISGGSFASGTEVACKMKMSQDITNPTGFQPSCDDFTCTVAGAAVPCGEMQEVMQSDGACT